MAWAEIGLKGAPSIMDVQTAVSTYNFERHDSEVRQNLSSFMCHSASTQERFYALHKNLKRAKQIRDLFVCLAVQETTDDAAAAPAEVEEESKETPKKMLAALSNTVKKVKEKAGLVRGWTGMTQAESPQEAGSRAGLGGVGEGNRSGSQGLESRAEQATIYRGDHKKSTQEKPSEQYLWA
ncbi:hypothetical protein D5F01_LYC23818 [Larimichthys crocea]|uniref:Uncharacterized protein n=1 Tax=Larimichthys crocea TaxID=215358 RepID=A0A6G0HGI8_LARCR|nr:hypothetical protein D5F01_LYC23818 [Larimichthys crocea]